VPSLDPATLLIVSCATTFLVGLQFLITWRQIPTSHALALWGAAHLVGSFGSIMLALRGHIPDWISIGAGNVAMITAYGVIWSGVRSFERQPPHILPAILVSGIWGLLCLIPSFYASIPMRVAVASLVAGMYCAGGAWEFWRSRAELLPSRRYAIGLLACYAFCYFIRVPATFMAPLPVGQNPLSSRWVAVLCLIAMLFSIASAFTFIGLTKERAEREQRLAAGTDPLTGIANRRAFVEAANALLAKRGEAALLLFDLDRFKAVNDRFGHEVGDAVLVAFCTVAEETLPCGAVFGRLGGEEFVCLLIDADPATARRLAERLRETFARIAMPELPDLRLSVNVGIAQASPGSDFDRMLRHADRALYVAKERGRNRVEVAEPNLRAA
jgi:diguanylate cyclase (GGDEF)-like protein